MVCDGGWRDPLNYGQRSGQNPNDLSQPQRISLVCSIYTPMTTQHITIELPEQVIRQLTQIAEATQQSVESLITQSIVGNLPPSANHAAPETQMALLRLQTLNIEELLAIAQAQVEPSQNQRHEQLLLQNQDDRLTPEEQQELTLLRQASDQMMLQKAYAWSVLRWRGYRVPTLKELVAPS
jgi:hypothetical protein